MYLILLPGGAKAEAMWQQRSAMRFSMIWTRHEEHLKLTFYQKFDDRIVIFRLVRECTVIAGFNNPSFAFNVFWIARTMLAQIKRAVTEKTVKILQSLMAWEIFTLFIRKKS